MLHELMGWYSPMTHRQFAVWQVWLSMEMNQPSRADHYAMQTAFYVARSSAKNPNGVSFNRFKLKFNDSSGENETKVSPEEMNARVVAMSLARLGKGKIRLPDGTPISKKEIIERTLNAGKKKQESDEDNLLTSE